MMILFLPHYLYRWICVMIWKIINKTDERHKSASLANNNRCRKLFFSVVIYVQKIRQLALDRLVTSARQSTNSIPFNSNSFDSLANLFIRCIRAGVYTPSTRARQLIEIRSRVSAKKWRSVADVLRNSIVPFISIVESRIQIQIKS